MNKKIFYSGFIRTLFEGILDVTISSIIQLKHFSFEDYTHICDCLLALVTLAVVLGSPILIPIVTIRNQGKLSNDEFYNKYNQLYEGLQLNQRSALLYTCAFCFRRVIFSVSATVFTNSLVF